LRAPNVHGLCRRPSEASGRLRPVRGGPRRGWPQPRPSPRRWPRPRSRHATRRQALPRRRRRPRGRPRTNRIRACLIPRRLRELSSPRARSVVEAGPEQTSQLDNDEHHSTDDHRRCERASPTECRSDGRGACQSHRPEDGTPPHPLASNGAPAVRVARHVEHRNETADGKHDEHDRDHRLHEAPSTRRARREACGSGCSL
jgi:hypothetical protein